MINPAPSQKNLLDGIRFPDPGRYVVAVSGGVDSVALLDILAAHGQDLDLAVAHFDHGWDDHPEADARASVAAQANVYGLPFYIGNGGRSKISEEQGRRSRYDFLFGLAAALGAKAVITAHHGDDKFETSIFNIGRGTSRRGRAPGFEHPGIVRPLINLTKSDLRAYAAEHQLPVWNDTADADLRFSRNFIRHELIPTAEQNLPGFSWLYRELMKGSESINSQIENRLSDLAASISTGAERGIEIDRQELSAQSLPVIAELLAYVVRKIEPGLQLSRERLKQLSLAVKTGRPGIQKDIAGRLKLRVGYDRVAVVLPRPEAAANLEN